MKDLWKLITIFVLATASVVVITHLPQRLTSQSKGQVEDSGKIIPKTLTEQEKRQACLKDRMCKNLAEVLYFESRGESVEGMVAVAFVVLNRINHPHRWGNTVASVIGEKAQFSYKWDGSMKRGFAEQEAYNKVLVVAYKVLNGKKKNPVGEADHYKTLAAKPKWDYTKLTKVAVVGNHVFYKHK